MDQKAQEAVEKVDSSCDGHELFRIAKQRDGEKSDIVGVSCLKDESGAVKVSMDDRKKIWKEHMEKLMIFNDILFKNKLPEEWMLSSLVPIF